MGHAVSVLTRSCTGCSFRLCQTFHWHQNKGCVLERGPHNKTKTFVVMSTGGWEQHEWSTPVVPMNHLTHHCSSFQVGARMLDLVYVRDRASRRETKLLNVLLMIKSTLWKGRPPVRCCYCSLVLRITGAVAEAEAAGYVYLYTLLYVDNFIQ